MTSHRLLRQALAVLLVALLAACKTVPPAGAPPANVSRLPPGNAQRDGPEANPPPNLDQVPDAVPQIEPLRVGGPNKPYEVAGHTYVPLTDDRPVTEKGLASWYGKRFHGHRTASGEAYNMYAMTAAHKTLPIPSYARVRNPANGHEVIVRVNDRGPFSPGRIIDLSYTAALKLGVLGGVQTVEISRITDDDIRTGAAFRHSPTYAAGAPPPASPATTSAPTSIAIGDLDRPTAVVPANRARPLAATSAASQPAGVTTLPPSSADVLATAADPSRSTAAPGRPVPPPGAVGAGATGATIDLGAAAAADSGPAVPGTTTTVTTEVLPAGASTSTSTGVPAGVVLPPSPTGAASGVPATTVVAALAPQAAASTPAIAPAPAPAPARAEPRDEHARADTTAGVGFWLQLGAFKQRDGALEFQRRLIDEAPWLAPLMAVFTDHGLNKLQAGPYTSRDDAKAAAERIRASLQLVPTIVEKR